MSKSNVKNNNNGNRNGFLISKNKTSRFSAASRASLTRTPYVSLDNADKVIAGGPLKPFFGLSGDVSQARVKFVPSRLKRFHALGQTLPSPYLDAAPERVCRERTGKGGPGNSVRPELPHSSQKTA